MVTDVRLTTLLSHANPVPDVEKIDLGGIRATRYLATLEQRSSAMTQLNTKQKDQEENRTRAMAKTFNQMADEEMERAHEISPEDALAELQQDTNALLVDVRDRAEVAVTGMGIGALNAPGRSLAWKADLEIEEEYRSPHCKIGHAGSSRPAVSLRAIEVLQRRTCSQRWASPTSHMWPAG